MSDLKQTDLSKRLRDLVIEAERNPAIAPLSEILGQAAEEIERYYTGMLNWKATAEAKDRRTQPETTTPAQDLSAAILALPLPERCYAKDVHALALVYSEKQMRDILKAAAALASSANALSGAIDKDAKIAAQRARIMELEEQLARALGTPVNDWCPECHARESSGDALSAGDRVDTRDWQKDCEILLHIWDDGKFPYENRCYVSGALQQHFEEVRAAILQSQKGGGHG